MLDPYYVLGLAQTATADEIRAAYRHKAAETHPDRQPPEQRAIAEEQMKALNAARDLLLDPRRRAVYDDKMRLEMQKAMWRARRDSAIFEEAFAAAPPRPRRRRTFLTGGTFIAWTIIMLVTFMVIITFLVLGGTEADPLSPLSLFAGLIRCGGSGFLSMFLMLFLAYLFTRLSRFFGP